MSDGSVVCPHTLGSFGFDADTLGGDVKQSRYAGPNCQSMRAYLRSRKDQRGIYVGYREARLLRPPESLLEKDCRVRALPLRVLRRKQRADIRCRDRAKQGVGQSVQQDVSIRMAAQSLRVRQCHPADLEWDTSLELV